MDHFGESKFRPIVTMRQDGKAIGAKSRNSLLKQFFINSGFSAVCIYRFQQYFQKRSAFKLAALVSRLNVIINGVEMVVGCEFGPYLIIRHPVGIVVGHKVKAGSNITLMQNVTIGQLHFESDTDRGSGNPRLGDFISIGANALILGNIEIGSNSVIGAGSFLNKDLPEGYAAVGNPAKIFPINK